MDQLASYAIIEFPGSLRKQNDPRYAIAALGGEDAVRSSNRLSFGDKTRPLTLNLRPGMGASPSNIVSEKLSPKPNMFVLRVTEDLDAAPGDDQTCSTPHKPNHTAPAKSRVSSVSSVVLGQVTSITSFRSIADYQFHPRKLIQTARTSTAGTPPRRFKRPSEVSSEALFPVAKQFCKEPRDDDMDYLIERLRPVRFARSQHEYGDTDYWYRQVLTNLEGARANFQTNRPVNRSLIDDRRSDAKRLEGLFHRVKLDVEKVPSGPHPSINPPSVRGRGSFVILKALIEKLFKIRPIWIRKALMDGIPANLRSSFKGVIVNAGYCFQGPGPFYHAWIRYGYDPRVDPDARKYQVVQVRINHPVIIQAAELQKQDVEDVDNEFSRDIDVESQAMDNCERDESRHEFKLPSAYQLSPELPLRKNNFAQLCDIKLPEVAEFCESTKPEETFDKKFGFFTESSHRELTTIIRKSLVRVATEFIRKHRGAHHMQDYDKFPNEAMRQKSKRLRLHSVIHPRTLVDKQKESEPDDVRPVPDLSQFPQSADRDIAQNDMEEAREPGNLLNVETADGEPAASDEPLAGQLGGQVLDLGNLDDVQAFDVLGADDEDNNDSDDFDDEDNDDAQD
eukprot:GFKZ01008456.1.p1 GENE.GFKZ01008456.1~~GFKZ01008456.1.p1  ORF type:complete len:621 (+),score=91.73 GFKZ01008456.1:300-2162(+)